MESLGREDNKIQKEPVFDQHPVKVSKNIEKNHDKRTKTLSVVLLIIISLSFGYLGGWLGSRDSSRTSANLQSQKVVLSSEGQIISGIAKNVGPSVVSVD